MGIHSIVMKGSAVFLDRDGVLTRNVFYADCGEFESPRRTADLQLFPGTGSFLRQLNDAGFALFIVSNQPSFAKSKTTLQDLESVRRMVREWLDAAGVRIQDDFYCFHHPQSNVPEFGPCNCRKPSPEFLLRAAAEFEIDLSTSWMVGDRATDVECGRRAGVRTIRIAPDHMAPGWEVEEPQADFQAGSLPAAVRIILRHRS